jgi:beta-lactamase superfamily II metal-dependent hydrolase
MSEDIQIRTVTVELLRAGPAHNQLLSPLTQYLGVCDDAEAGVVTLPFEHNNFMRRMRAMRYDSKQIIEDRLPELRAMGIEMAKVLGSIPRLPGALSGDSRGRDLMVHLSLVLSASELASLPFELAKMPIGPTTWTESWLALQARVPVVMTRRTRNVSSRDFRWLFEPRILFISSDPNPENVPFSAHRDAMLDAVWPFLTSEDLPATTEKPDGRYYKREESREQYGRVLTILSNPRFDDVVRECARYCYTHIHILAHGDTDSSQGDRTSGLVLHPDDGVISGERLASALTRIVGGVIHRPDVVTLATCDSGKIESVVEPGASIAHLLHQAGVPLVLASQFPLGKEASTLMVQEFYGGLLWGEHPWILLHRVRSTLHGQLTAQDHDWASLVVYESMPVPPDLNYKLDKARFAQCERALRATWLRNGSAHARSQEWPLKRVIEKMPLSSKYVGMQALALKADALLLKAQGDYDSHVCELPHDSPRFDEQAYKTLVIKNYALLEESLDCYQAAVEGFLINEGQGMTAPFMALAAQLRLSAVVGRYEPKDKGAWEMARYWSETTLEQSEDAPEKLWAHCCLAELWLLKLLDAPEPGVDPRERALEASHEIARLDRQRLGQPVQWTMGQLENYVAWWGHRPFEHWVRKLCEGARKSFLDKGGVVDTAFDILNIIDKQSQREINATTMRAAPARHSPAPAPLGKPAPAPSAAIGEGRLGGKAAAPQPQSKARASAANQAGAPFFNIDMLPAAHGDALWIEYGHAGHPVSRVLVDCGTTADYKTLKARVLQVPAAERHFELFILSHIDADHIGGAIPFLQDTEALGLSFGDVWFNGYKHLASQRLGAAQGETFSALIQDKSLPWNAWQANKAIVRPNDALPSLTLPGGMKLTLLSPTRQKLAALADTWQRDIEAMHQKPGDIDDGRRRLGQVPDTSEDVDWLVDPRNRPFASDTAEPNGSSIAVLAEFEGKSVLLGADAHSGVLEEAIRILIKAPGSANRLPLSAFKVSHHASQNNLSPELMQLLNCREYLISTNGAHFNHPDRAAIARVIHYGGPKARLWFNYRSKLNEVWDKPELQAKYGYTAVYPRAGESGLKVTLF